MARAVIRYNIIPTSRDGALYIAFVRYTRYRRCGFRYAEVINAEKLKRVDFESNYAISVENILFPACCDVNVDHRLIKTTSIIHLVGFRVALIAEHKCLLVSCKLFTFIKTHPEILTNVSRYRK